MLELYVGTRRYLDESNNKVITVKGDKLQLEHSLFSIAKWESKWHKPFLTEEKKTPEETLDYVKDMTLNEVDPGIYNKLTRNDINQIVAYMKDSMTATWFSKKEKQQLNTEIITSEIVYYWMVSANIPMECQYWHINRLLTLVRVISLKNQKEEKMSKKDVYAHQAHLNKMRRPHVKKP